MGNDKNKIRIIKTESKEQAFNLLKRKGTGSNSTCRSRKIYFKKNRVESKDYRRKRAWGSCCIYDKKRKC